MGSEEMNKERKNEDETHNFDKPTNKYLNYAARSLMSMRSDKAKYTGDSKSFHS